MYSPFNPAKHYKGFTYSLNQDVFKEQLNNFASHEKFKWLPESKTEKGTYQLVPSLIMIDGEIKLRTNALFEIENGDIVWLEHPAFKNKYFVVSETPQIDSVLLPRWRQTYQHLVLRPLSFEEPNITRS